jgi:hypothetical protein
VTRRDREREVVEVVGADGHVDPLFDGWSARFERAGVEGGLDTLALRRGQPGEHDRFCPQQREDGAARRVARVAEIVCVVSASRSVTIASNRLRRAAPASSSKVSMSCITPG